MSPAEAKNSILLPSNSTPNHNFITHLFLAWQKTQIVKAIAHPIPLPLPVQKIPPSKISNFP